MERGWNPSPKCGSGLYPQRAVLFWLVKISRDADKYDGVRAGSAFLWRQYFRGNSMLRKSWLLILIAGFIVPAFGQQENSPSFDGKTWWEHVKVLAADNMEGRDTGSPGLKRGGSICRRSIEERGASARGSEGFLPAGEVRYRGNWWRQESSAALVRDGKAEPLNAGRRRLSSARAWTWLRKWMLRWFLWDTA